MKEKISNEKGGFSKKSIWSQQFAAHCGDQFVIEYLSEIETKFENTLGCSA